MCRSFCAQASVRIRANLSVSLCANGLRCADAPGGRIERERFPAKIHLHGRAQTHDAHDGEILALRIDLGCARAGHELAIVGKGHVLRIAVKEAAYGVTLGEGVLLGRSLRAHTGEYHARDREKLKRDR